jgi:5-formyltetrahydrofolate cyclo-ligase
VQDVPLKHSMRRPLRAARRARTPAERERAALLIAEAGLEVPVIRDAGCVALYASLPDEPGTGPLRDALRARGVRVILPIVPTTECAPTAECDVAQGSGSVKVPGTTATSHSRAEAHGHEHEHGLDWAVDVGGDLVESRVLRVPEPEGARLGPSALGEADVVLVPALAVDAHGNRLGKGRGYYDAALRHASPGVPVIAVLFDDEVSVAPIPREPHDVPVNGVLTPSRWIWF